MANASGKTISINIRAITGELTSGLNKAKAETASWASSTNTSIAAVEASTERISRLWRSLFEAFIGVAAVDVLKKLALGADEASTQLSTAARVAKNFGHSLDPKQMEGWLDKFAMSAEGGGYAINDMRSAVQKFAAVGLDGAQIQRALAETANLAAARQLDFGEAADIVARGLTGHIELWTRMGIITREAAKNIHTTEEAFKALDKAIAGAAAERANKLVGDFGRLGTAASLFADKLGGSLAPFFTAVATALTKLVQLLDEVPAPVLKVAGSLLAFGTSLAATVLVLPAIAKGIAIMGEGLRLVTGLVMPAITLVARLATTLGLGATGFEAFTAAEIASAVPNAAIIAALAGVAIAVEEITHHTDHVKTAWHDWCQYLSDSFHEFVENFQRDHTVLVRLIEGVAKLTADAMSNMMNPLFSHADLGADVNNIMKMAAPRTQRIEGPKLSGDASQIGTDIVGDWKHIGTQVLDFFKNLFKSSLGPSPHIPHPPYDNTVPGKGGGKDAGPAAAEDRLKNAEEAIKEFIAALANHVADARHQVEKSATAVDDYKAGLPGGQPQNAAQQVELQKLITNEMRAQQALHDRLEEQQKAELKAESFFEQYAARISTHLKNHDQLVRQAKDAALEHLRAAQQLGEEYLKIGVTVAQLKNDIRSSFESLVAKTRETSDAAADALLDQQRIQNESDQAAIQQQIDMLPYGGAGALSFNGPAAQGPHERSARAAAESEAMHPGSKNANVEADRLRVALAALAVAIAQDTEDDKAKHVAAAQNAYDAVKSADNLKALTDAQNAYSQSVVDATKAQDSYVLATQKLIQDQQQKWDELINGLVQKIGAPGLSVNPNTAALSFDPTQLFMAALEQSQTFGDVMATVTQIVQTFAQAIEAFRPIIDALLDVVRAVVNVFIFLYNTVARILDLFGLQIQQLQYLNSAIGGLVPLIQIWHEIPTLNELAAGKLNSPLSTTPTGLQNVGGPGQGQNGLMKVVEILAGILVAVIVEKVISGMSLAAATQSTMHLLGINVGQKVQIGAQQTNNALTVATNAAITTGFTLANGYLMQILMALQEQAASSGGVMGLFNALTDGGSIPVGIGMAVQTGVTNALSSFRASLSGGASDAFSRFRSAIGGSGAAFTAHTQAVRENFNAFRDATQGIRQFRNQLGGLGDLIEKIGSGSNISRQSILAMSAALSIDTSRRIASTSYGIDRVP
jgi:hypothetical protein